MSAGEAVAAGGAESEAIFEDVAEESGLGFVHFNGMSGRYFFNEMMGSGAALFDYDGDGDLDVYLVQGNMLGRGLGAEDATFPPPGPLPLSDRLYRNDLVTTAAGGRTLRFTDVTAESGIAAGDEDALGYGMGVAVGDFDNDGRPDLYVTNHGPNRLLRNLGGGVFADVTAASGAGDPRWSVPAVVFDFDSDGWLDLFVGNYVAYSTDANKECRDELGAPNYCGPLAFSPLPDALLRNLGGGGLRFEDVSVRSGISAEAGGALGAVAADFDGDGRLDLYVANDGMPNFLWINEGDGRFENHALLGGAAVSGLGRPQASMGLAAADFDGDGDEDLFMTHLRQETNTLYVNDGRGVFEDRSAPAGLGGPTLPYTGFGTGFFDYDNDGWLDLLAVNGAVKVIKELALAGDPFPLHEPNQLFRNRGDGSFEEVTERAGAVFALSEVSRGAAFGDVDNDGDLDVLITNNAGPVRLLLNRRGQDRHWLGLRLVAAIAGGAARDVPGARAGVWRADGRVLWRRVGTTASYASASDPRLLFGLGETVAIERIEVHWPDGLREEWGSEVAIDAYTTLRRGEGRALTEEPR